MSYRLLCVDAGFTLLTPRRTLGSVVWGILAGDRYSIAEEVIHAAWDDADRSFWAEYQRPGNETWTDDRRIDDFWRQYHSAVLDRLGIKRPGNLLDRIIASQFAPDAWEPYADAEPMLRAVCQMGVRIGVVSDWGSDLQGVLADQGLGAYVDFVIPSGAVGVAKPNPALYRLAVDAAGVAPWEALMVGDSYRADVRGAWSAGLGAVWLDRKGRMATTTLDEPVPTDVRRIRTLCELPGILRSGGPLPRG